MTTVPDDVLTLEWYHPSLTRHVAESLLLQNGIDGTYLLRPSSKKGELALSLRAKDSVKHFPIHWDGQNYQFGMATFSSVDEFVSHFKNQPMLGGETGVLTLLKHPYPREVDDFQEYESVRVHAEIGQKKRQASTRPDFFAQSGSKEGYLTKLGGRIKNWKSRWFVLVKTELKYFKESTEKQPIRSLDLIECSEAERDDTKGKKNCFRIQARGFVFLQNTLFIYLLQNMTIFPENVLVYTRLVFPWRTFYMYASSEEEANEWLKLIKWKLDKVQRSSAAV